LRSGSCGGVEVDSAVEQLTYGQIAERHGCSAEAARALVRRLGLPRTRGSDGRTLVTINLQEIPYRPQSARSPGGDRPVDHPVAAEADSSSPVDIMAAEAATSSPEPEPTPPADHPPVDHPGADSEAASPLPVDVMVTEAATSPSEPEPAPSAKPVRQASRGALREAIGKISPEWIMEPGRTEKEIQERIEQLTGSAVPRDWMREELKVLVPGKNRGRGRPRT
jgi:hypothetical protein